MFIYYTAMARSMRRVYCSVIANRDICGTARPGWLPFAIEGHLAKATRLAL